MAHRLTTAPQVPILTADDAREQCRIDDSAEDTYLQKLIARATRHCEDICKRAFVTQVWTLTMDGWCDCRYVTDGIIYVPRPPLLAVSGTVLGATLGITYLDSNGSSQTLSASDYRVDATSEPGRIEPAYGVTWPTLRDAIGNVSIVHSCGYGSTSASVPEAIHHAIAMLVAHWAINREASLIGTISKSLEHAIEDLLDPYVMEVYA